MLSPNKYVRSPSTSAPSFTSSTTGDEVVGNLRILPSSNFDSIDKFRSNDRLYRNKYVELHKLDKSNSSNTFTKHFITSNDQLHI